MDHTLDILLLTRKLDENGGGSNRSLRLIADHLSDQGHYIHLVTINSQKNNIKQLNNDVDLTEHDIERSRIREIRKTVEIIKQFDGYDIIHIFNPGLIPAGGIYRRQGKTPVVGRLNHYSTFCTNPDMISEKCYSNCSTLKKISHDERSSREKILKIPEYTARTHFVPKIVNKIDTLFAISPTVREVFSANGFRDISIVPNFIDPSFMSGTSGPTGGGRDGSQILYVGRLREKKGVDCLIDAFHQLDHDVHLHIVGDGSESDELQGQVEDLSLSNKVTFHGWVDYDQLPVYYEMADVFVHPGRWPEPFGNTILEALQFGTPCIVSDTGGPPWIAGDACLAFEPDNTQGLTQAMSKYLKNEEIQRELKSNCNKQLNRFTPESTVNKIEAEYSKII